MKNISLNLRLIIPIALLGIVALLSNILSIINIHNVNASAANISDNYMDGKDRLSKISQTSMDIHMMALSHIVATDYDTMITLVQQIKEEETVLDEMLAEYQQYVIPEDQEQYQLLLIVLMLSMKKPPLRRLFHSTGGSFGKITSSKLSNGPRLPERLSFVYSTFSSTSLSI